MMTMWFGLTGRNASGKTTVVDWFKAQDYAAGSCSDSIRAWLREAGREINRDNLIEGGRTLREQGGGGVLAEMLLEANADVSHFIVDSIRTPDEVVALRARPDFRLIEIRASRDARWERLVERGRTGDAETYEQFVEQEERELAATGPGGQALDATAEMADFVIMNDGSEAELIAALEEMLAALS